MDFKCDELILGKKDADSRALTNKLREYEDRLALSSRNSSKSPSSDSPAAKAERKKLRRLVAEIRLALNLDTRGIDEN